MRDTGIGISAADLPYVFERFWRADRARSRGSERGGFGLGLAISQWIAQAHGGRIVAQSRLGRGSVVHRHAARCSAWNRRRSAARSGVVTDEQSVSNFDLQEILIATRLPPDTVHGVVSFEYVEVSRPLATEGCEDMFNNLLESKPKKQRTTGGLVFSGVLHAMLGTAAVYGTLQAKEKLEKPKAEKVEFVDMKKKEPPPPKEEPKPMPKDVVVAPPPPKGFQVLTAPIKVPDVLPDIDLSKKVTDEADFSGKGVQGGTSKGVVGGTGPVNTDQPYFEFQVEKQVAADSRYGQPALPGHAPLGERRRRGTRPVRRERAGPLRGRHVQGSQVIARALHAGRQERAAQHALLSGGSRRQEGEAARPATVHVLAHQGRVILFRRKIWISRCWKCGVRMGNFAKGIVFVMVIMSVYSLTIMVAKWWSLRKAQKETLKFAPEFSQFLEEDNLTEAIKLAESYKKSHVALVLGGALSEVKPLIQDGSVTVSDINSAERAVERNMLLEITNLKRGLAVLATVGATAPFVGLLGTTIGIINAFAGMASVGFGRSRRDRWWYLRSTCHDRARSARRHPGGVGVQLLPDEDRQPHG